MKNTFYYFKINANYFLLSAFVLAISLLSCGQKNTVRENKISEIETTHFDTSRIAILPFDTSHFWIFENCKPAELTNADLQSIDTLLTHCINEYNPEQEKKFEAFKKQYPKYKLDIKNYIIDLSRYKRQYVAVLNPKGEKEVWVNCFCSTHNPDWSKKIVDVNDGGNCYFNVKINLTTGKYFNIMVNGEA